MTLAVYLSSVLNSGSVVPPNPTGLLAQFRLRYPAFAAVPDETVQIWLDEAEIDCALWPDATRDRATLLLAAHRLTIFGAVPGGVPAGVTSFKSGTFSATVSDKIAGLTGLESTIYGREFMMLRRVAFSGPIMAWTPPVPANA